MATSQVLQFQAAIINGLQTASSTFNGAATGASPSKTELEESFDLIVVKIIEFTIKAIAKKVVSFVKKFPFADDVKTA